MKYDKVMHMDTLITITSKGQTTIPVAVRRQLGIPASGGTLQISYDQLQDKAVISKPMTIEDLSEEISKKIKPGIKPVLNVDDYYQTHRRVVGRE